jgi:DNA-binding MarR family transcriptional regulator
MLEKRRKGRKALFAEELERYLGKTLHAQVHVDALDPPASLPSFLAHAYAFYKVSIAGSRFIILAAREKLASTADIAKHVRQLRSAVKDTIVVFAAPSIGAHHRARLLEQGVPFVVPGNQLYIPDLAIDLREHFRAPRPVRGDGLSPAAQAVLFLHLLRRDDPASSPSVFAERLRYTAMSIGRAFDELVALGLAEDERHGRERRLRFKLHGRQLFEVARDHLRSPVRAVKYAKGGRIGPSLKLAGESALAELTDLSTPQLETYAVAATAWKDVADEHQLVETDRYDAKIKVETWSYDPAGLSDGSAVDPLSLYAQFKDDTDERIAGAAQQLLEEITW